MPLHDDKRRHSNSPRRATLILLALVVCLTGLGIGGGILVARRLRQGRVPDAAQAVATSMPTIAASTLRSKAPSATPTPAPASTFAITPTQRPTPMPTQRPTPTPTQRPTPTPTQRPTPTPTPEAIDTVDALYAAMWQVIDEGLDHIDYVRLSEDDIDAVMEDLNYYTKSYYWYRNGATGYVSLTFEDIAVSRRALRAWRQGRESDLDDEALSMLRQAESVVRSLNMQGMTDWEKELAIHDYIIDHCVYDVDVERLHTDDARGFFQHGRCQCSGYSDVFWMLGTMAGLDVRIISGEITSGLDEDVMRRFGIADNGHSWNVIRLDGAWYGLDVTWDDPVGDAQVLSHAYFNVPIPFLRESRYWSRAQDVEGFSATSFDDNYYYIRAYGAPENQAYTADEAVSLSIRQIQDHGEAIVCFTDKANIDVVVQSVANGLANHYNDTCWYSAIVHSDMAFASHLPYYIYRFYFR